MRKLILTLFIAVSLQSCSDKMGINTIANTKWVLTKWPNQMMPKTDKKATLNFTADNKINGTSFCNGFGGTSIIRGETIKFGDLLSTMMYCEDVGKAEGNFTADLGTVNAYRVIDGKLHLLKDGKTLMIFTKTQ